jgi:GGDEF domain-containing protein
VAEKDQLTSELQRANSELANLAATDSLTQLPNKRSFNDVLARELALADRNATTLSLLMVDVDHFKKVNDMRNHFFPELPSELAVNERLRLRAGREMNSISRRGE